MATWKLYLRDYMKEGGAYTITGMSNGRVACKGLPTSVAAITATPSIIAVSLPSSPKMRAIAIDGHNLDGCTISASWGASKTVSGNGPQLWDLGASSAGSTYSVTIVGGTGKQIMNVGLLGSETGGSSSKTTYIEFAGSWFTYPIGRQMNAGMGIQRTGTGMRIEQRRGGASQILACHCHMLQPNATSGTQFTSGEAYLDDSFMSEDSGTQGWLGPIWLVDDNGTSYHCHVVRPLNIPWIAAGGFADFDLVVETIPVFMGA
jgi:hypothetical protein